MKAAIQALGVAVIMSAALFGETMTIEVDGYMLLVNWGYLFSWIFLYIATEYLVLYLSTIKG